MVLQVDSNSTSNSRMTHIKFTIEPKANFVNYGSLLEKAKIEYFASTSVEMNSVFLLELAVTNTFILML